MKINCKVWTVVAGLSVALLGAACGGGNQESAPAPAGTMEATMMDVVSTTFSKVGYNPGNQELTVEFKDGGETYTYAGVPADVYEQMREAESIGAFYHANIKGKYEEARK